MEGPHYQQDKSAGSEVAQCLTPFSSERDYNESSGLFLSVTAIGNLRIVSPLCT